MAEDLDPMADEEEGEYGARLGEIRAEVRTINRTVDRISKAIEGNGNGPGLRMIVDRHEQTLVQMVDNNRWLFRLVMGVVLASLLQFGWAILRYGIPSPADGHSTVAPRHSTSSPRHTGPAEEPDE